MFSCVVHNWNSHSAPCPMCFPATYTSASGSEDFIINSEGTEDSLVNNLREDRNKYRDAFESQIVEIAQQDSEITALQSSLKEKESRISGLEFACEQWEKKCDALENKLEELKAENEALKSNLYSKED